MSEPIVLPPTPHLIIEGKLVENDLRRFEPEPDTHATPDDEAGWLVPVSVWVAHPLDDWKQRRHPVALLVEPHTELESLFEHSSLSDLQAHVSLIAVDFPAYTDGRGYSLAQLLRQQYGWTGELRAVGDVMIDTMHYLARCGFDSFLVKPGHNPQAALAALATFTLAYQKSYRHSAQVASLAPAA
ncbi:DUF934 domain-containing protein [Pusillimonas sp. CC-YST705]|uniref:DUF934 domain-containing protein n=1 Tax=Mesopusillimonas faecipullorum TaxID=2755040 RepID=A0ABS8CDV6_9BURK|nr:DUF934 domain-containing protein [Mesopusillimonas faecipullorum]MCB5364009.1 DUF934 domain-containing protein [Mesopusillimonas faecipullorum]